MAGARATRLGPWYARLRRPSWQPPDSAFGPAWSTIFLLAAIAFVLGWNAPAADTGSRAMLLGVYVVNGVLNFLWSVLFFRLQRPDWALAETPLLWLSIGAIVIVLLPLSTLAAWLLAPYLAWVTFACALTFRIVQLNRPFGERQPTMP